MTIRKGKALFVIHDNCQDDNNFPLGPGYLAAMLKRYGSEVSVFCMDVFHYSNEQLIVFLLDYEFDLIGLGFMAPRFKRGVEELCKTINAHKKNAWFVIGGHGPTPIPEFAIKATGADVAIIGEGEETIVELLQCKLSDPGRISTVKGIAYRNGDQIIENQRRKPIMKLDTIPFPAWELFPMDRYTTCIKYSGMKDEDKSLGMITSRGCVNKCSFCHRMETGIRVRTVANIIEELKTLHNIYGVNYFHFADELSIVSKKQVLEFTKAIKDNELSIMYRMDCRVDLFDEDIAKALKDSGCVFLNIGFESTDQAVLDLLDKRVTVEQNIKAAEIAKRHGIGLGLNFIWGLPGDSEKSLRDNVEFIKRYNQYEQIRTIRPVTPFPGSPLYYEAVRRGILQGPDDFFKRFKNTDLYMVNFMDIPENEIYQMLFEVNKDLIMDHYWNTNNDMEAANCLIDQFYNLYFNDDYAFKGARHYDSNVGMRRDV